MMTSKCHSLLKRQLKKHFTTMDKLPPEMHPFITAVNEAYLQFDEDRYMLERSLELSSDELLQANSELRAIFQALPDLFFIINGEGKIIDAKAGNLSDLLMHPKKLTGKHIYDIYHDEVGHKFLDAIKQLENGAPLATLEYVMQLADKKNIFEARLLPLRENQIIAIIRNITKQQEARQALKESEARYRKVLEASPDPIIVYDMQGVTNYINPAFTKIFGWTIDEIYMQRVDYIPEACRAHADKLRTLATSGKGFSGIECRRLTKSGKIIDVSISASVWQDPFGDPAGIVVTLRDITEKKELEARLIQAHKMEAIGLLAGGVAHDFNNLLTGISGTVSLMMSELIDDDPFYKQLSNIEHYIASAAELTGQLLGFAQGGKYEIKPTNVNTLIQQSTAMFGRTKKQIRIDLNLADDIWTVEVDEVQIEQVLVNLYVNAWQAMPEGGILTVQTENVTLDEKTVRIKKLPQDRMIKITVSDTGEGIDETDLQYIFDPFFTTKEVGKGNGLGLASTYGIIKNHGGSIDVTSRINHGATFTIYLPASAKSMEDKTAIPDRIVSGTETILLIDDETMVREVGQEMLKELGYHVKVAASGEEGIQIYETDQRNIDLVILDLIMPGTSGGETFDRLRKLNPEAKVLLASGYSVDGQAAAILERGCKGFMQKPFNMKQLSRKIREALKK